MPITTREQLTTVISVQQRQQERAEERLDAAHADGKHDGQVALKCGACMAKGER